jgi:hypothetical protein
MNRRIGGSADRRIGGSADRRIGGSADRRDNILSRARIAHLRIRIIGSPDRYGPGGR